LIEQLEEEDEEDQTITLMKLHWTGLRTMRLLQAC
jgi:hypothetical protein